MATEYKKRVDTLNAENLDLKSEVDNLVFLRNSFNSEKDNLLSLLEESKTQLEELERQNADQNSRIFGISGTSGSSSTYSSSGIYGSSGTFTKDIKNNYPFDRCTDHNSAKDIENDRCADQNTIENQAIEIEECKKQIAYLTKLYEDSHEILYNMSELTQNMSLGEAMIRIEETSSELKGQGKEVGYLPRLMGQTYPGKLANLANLVANLANLANLSKLANLAGIFAKNEDNDNNNANNNIANASISPYDLETLLNMKDPSTKND